MKQKRIRLSLVTGLVLATGAWGLGCAGAAPPPPVPTPPPVQDAPGAPESPEAASSPDAEALPPWLLGDSLSSDPSDSGSGEGDASSELEPLPWEQSEESSSAAAPPINPFVFTVQNGLLSENVRELVKGFNWQIKWQGESDRRIEAPFEIKRDTLEATLRRLLGLFEGSFVADLYQANRMVVVSPAPLGAKVLDDPNEDPEP